MDSRLYLDTIARRLHETYNFQDIRFREPTFGDVLAARRTKNYKLKADLEEVFTPEKWGYLEKLHEYTALSLHGVLDEDQKGNMTLTLPHKLFNPELAKDIALDAGVLFCEEDKDKLIVKDEDSSSGASSDS